MFCTSFFTPEKLKLFQSFSYLIYSVILYSLNLFPLSLNNNIHTTPENFKCKTHYIMALTLSHLPVQNFLLKSELHKPEYIFPYKPSYF